MKPFRLSLLHVLIIPPVLFTLAIGHIGSKTYQSMVTENINDFLVTEVHHIENEITYFLSSYFNKAESFLVSNAAYVETYIDKGRMDVDLVVELFQRQLQATDNIDYLYFTTMSGQIVSVGKTGRYAYSTAEQPLSFKSVTTSETGEKKESVRQVDFRNKAWFSDAITAGTIQWSDPYPGEQEDSLAISASFPVSINGELAGVMGIDILLDELNHFLRNFEPANFGRLFITYDKGLLGSNVSVTAQQLDSELSSSISEEIISRNDEDYFRTRTDLTTSQGNNYHLISLLPVTKLEKKFEPLFQHLQLIILAMVLFVIIFSVTVSLLVKRKINRLIRFLETLEQNQWRASLPDSWIRELNAMIRVVNHVLETLSLTLKSMGIDRENADPKTPQGTSLEQIIIDKSKVLQEELLLDPLTGAYNRRFLNTTFENLNPESISHYCLAVLDLDHFKRVNDEHGHDIGDTVLCEFVTNLNSFLRKNDILFRYGGEEFVVLFQTPVIEEAQQALSRYKQQLEKITLSEKGIRVSFSAGLIQMASNNLSEEITKADKALYKAKDLGRNRIIVNEPG